MNTDRAVDRLRKLRRDTLLQLEEIRAAVGVAVSAAAPAMEQSEGGSLDADAGAILFERDRQLAFELEYSNLLESIDHALTRANSGGYGTCEICGNIIAADRLKAIPYAVRCIKCQELEDGT
jgi:DnaK suppressor protein